MKTIVKIEDGVLPIDSEERGRTESSFKGHVIVNQTTKREESPVRDNQDLEKGGLEERKEPFIRDCKDPEEMECSTTAFGTVKTETIIKIEEEVVLSTWDHQDSERGWIENIRERVESVNQIPKCEDSSVRDVQDAEKRGGMEESEKPSIRDWTDSRKRVSTERSATEFGTVKTETILKIKEKDALSTWDHQDSEKGGCITNISEGVASVNQIPKCEDSSVRDVQDTEKRGGMEESEKPYIRDWTDSRNRESIECSTTEFCTVKTETILKMKEEEDALSTWDHQDSEERGWIQNISEGVESVNQIPKCEYSFIRDIQDTEKRGGMEETEKPSIRDWTDSTKRESIECSTTEFGCIKKGKEPNCEQATEKLEPCKPLLGTSNEEDLQSKEGCSNRWKMKNRMQKKQDQPTEYETFVSRSTFASKQRITPTGNTCTEYGKSSSQSKQCSVHQGLYTGETSYTCSDCGKGFSQSKNLTAHQRIHREKSYVCGECGKGFNDSSTLSHHHRMHTGEKPYSCSECGKCFTWSSALVSHQRIHTGEKLYTCCECGKSFRMSSALHKHQQVHTGDKPYTCSECAMCFGDQYKLTIHHRTHTGEKPYTCSECGKTFKAQSSLTCHQRTHTGERVCPRSKSYICSECGKAFSKSWVFVLHKRVHTGEKPYTCSECGKCFSYPASFMRHQRIHTGEKPYTCSTCGKCFNDTSTLVKHQQVHTGEKAYACSECGKCFGGHSILVRHQRIHTGEKPYMCSKCGRSFCAHASLKSHQRLHTGEKPYSCSQCEKCFLVQSSLDRHQKIHTEEKPFTCSECGKSFSKSPALIIHQRIHTGEKPYACGECKKCFSDPSARNNHQKIHMRAREKLNRDPTED